MDEGTKAINKKDEERAKFLAMLEQDEDRSTTVFSEYKWSHHLNYLYEEKMARPSSQLAFFAFSLVCMALSTGTAFYLCGGFYGSSSADLTMSEGVWQIWTIILDAGIQWNTSNEKFLLPNRAIAGFTTVLGVLFNATLTGFVVDGVKQKLDSFRSGKTQVHEWGHIVLVGWTDRTAAFIRETCLANESDGGGVIVVLAEDGKKTEVEEEFAVAARDIPMLGTRVIFRSGNPLKVESLRHASVHTAKCVVIMSVLENPKAADAQVLRIIVAVTVIGLMPDSHMVAEIIDPGEMAKVIRFTGGEQLETINSNDLNTRVSLSAVKQPGVTKAFQELFGFEGDEFYVEHWPETVGLKWQIMLCHFPEAVPIGVKTAGGDVLLVPDKDYVMQEGDGLVVLAEDDDAYSYWKIPPWAATLNPGKLPEYEPPPARKDRILVCGAGENLKPLLKKLPLMFDRGTEVHLLNLYPLDQRDKVLAQMDIEPWLLDRIDIKHIYGDPTSWYYVRDLDMKSYHCVLIIAKGKEPSLSDDSNLLSNDSKNLVTILLLRNHAEMKKDSEEKNYSRAKSKAISHESLDDADNDQSLFVEIKDTQTQELIETHPFLDEACHFLVSNRLVAKVLAMVAQDRTVSKILDSILGDDITIKLIPSEMFCDPSQDCSFFDISRRVVSNLSYIIIGYQYKTNVNLTSINPKDKSTKRNWANANFVALVRSADVNSHSEEWKKSPNASGDRKKSEFISFLSGSVSSSSSEAAVKNALESSTTTIDSGADVNTSAHVAFLERELTKRTENEVAAWEMLQRNADEAERMREDSRRQRERYEHHMELFEAQAEEFYEMREEFRGARVAYEGQVKMLEDKLNDLIRRDVSASPSSASATGIQPFLSRAATTGRFQSIERGTGSSFSPMRIQSPPSDLKDASSLRLQRSKSTSNWGQKIRKEKQLNTRPAQLSAPLEESKRADRSPQFAMYVQEAEFGSPRSPYLEQARL